jgi:DNA-binding MarR family transcriptional regulator
MGPRRGSSTISNPDDIGPGQGTPASVVGDCLPPTHDQLLSFSHELFAIRERRRDFVNANQLGEPAWDMMLALVIGFLQQRRLIIADVIRVSELPESTALRWIDVLQERGFIRYARDELDARATFVELEPEGRTKMIASLEGEWQLLPARKD